MNHSTADTVAIIGGGTAGLMAAEAAATAGAKVELFDSMPSVGRKFLLAGKGGLNLTHAEAFPHFISRYGERQESLKLHLQAFDPATVREWASILGIETFVGSSQRVFPKEMKAAPLLRAWLKRLRSLGVRFHVRHRWQGWDNFGDLIFETQNGPVTVRAAAVVLALGGGSWARLGSDGRWTPLLESRGLEVSPLRPANCGFDVGWSAYFAERFAGAPIKPVVVRFTNLHGQEMTRRGEFVITETGVEGSLIYALSSNLCDLINLQGHADLQLDLAPDRTQARLLESLQKSHRGLSLGNRLRRSAALEAAKIGLLRERITRDECAAHERLATAIKNLPLRLKAARPLDEAISSAGGLALEALDDQLMVRALPGLFCAGEMLDWEAPTGGYLLTACLATGRAAGRGAARWIGRDPVCDD
jgi:uncharacterized flavoprotein (TIGR03862 family)